MPQLLFFLGKFDLIQLTKLF
ncbi:protein of unknown function [Candidatus Nitrospira inopinata]|uniref:Uncharacterized protein n=1 Tax=Candidatus Nitrospira inopinata TaxID=1715989 RepID=A0A0S4KTR7_9BACT|nr:protein of unknown function [Candidatus Nitrospira inopinata]